MHPQNTDTDKDVDDTTGKGRETERLEQDEILQISNKQSAQRRDLESNIGSDNQPMERRGTNMDKF